MFAFSTKVVKNTRSPDTKIHVGILITFLKLDLFISSLFEPHKNINISLFIIIFISSFNEFTFDSFLTSRISFHNQHDHSLLHISLDDLHSSLSI